MSAVRQRPRLDFSSHGQGKNFVDFDPGSPNVGNLSPDLQTICSAPEFKPQHTNVCQIGKYFLLDHVEETNTYTAINKENGEAFVCKVFPIEKYRECLSAFWRADGNEHVSHISEIILGESKAYVIFDGNHGDLHGHVRQKKRLREDEASRLFQQIVTAVAHCHDNGIVLRDLKLRKFVFKDADKKHLRLEGLEDAYVCSSVADDRLTDKHGCPAYVSPEILNATQSYSGRAADIWSLGVMLYTMLIGRYPFHDTEPSALFTKIRRGQFTVPDILSTRAKCLIKSLLRRDPDERLTAHQILQHPWLKSRHRSAFSQRVNNPKNSDQTVPDTVFPNSDYEFYV